MRGQISMFDGARPFRFEKPVRLIEFFAGYGSQLSALKEILGDKVQHWKICEWAIKSIQAYKDNYYPNDNTDYSKFFTFDYIVDTLTNWGISANYSEPLTKEQVKRLGEKTCRKIYNNIVATHNLVNIEQVSGRRLEICDTNIYDYVLTYSFPCQDLSKAGKGAGMEKGSGTRSGLLWEVERILDECAVSGGLPKVLLMENVPDVIGQNNIQHFATWLGKLESMGYRCYWQVLNAKEFGIPQNRDRCFMISILGDYYYTFPKSRVLKNKLPDILEHQVDERFYLSQKAIQGKLDSNFRVSSFEGCLPQEDGCCRTICARDYKDPKCVIEVGEPNLKEQLCDMLVESGLLKAGTVINHSYTNGLTGKNPNSRQTLEDYIESTNGICNTLTTRPDVLGIAVEDLTTKNKRLAKMVDKIDPTKCQAIDIYNQTTHDEMQTIKTNVDRANMTAVTQDLRIRKLTPKECFRLMGVKDEAYERIAKHQSNASLYHLAGDSIVIPVLVAIFGQCVDGFDFDKYIEEFYNQIKGEK